MQKQIFDNIISTLPERDAMFYSHYVSERYREFAYKESFHRYKGIFRKCTLPTSINQSLRYAQDAHSKS